MKRVILSAAVGLSLIAGLTSSARATEVGSSRRFGLGFQVGDPTAIVGKAFVGSNNAFDFGLGFWGYGHGRCYDRDRDRYSACGGYGRLSLHGDFLWQENIVRSTVKLDWHIGGGARIYLWDDDGADGDDDLWLAARMPLGLDLTFNRPDFLEVFFELTPGLFLFPFLDFDIDVAIGVRFYF